MIESGEINSSLAKLGLSSGIFGRLDNQRFWWSALGDLLLVNVITFLLFYFSFLFIFNEVLARVKFRIVFFPIVVFIVLAKPNGLELR